MPKILNGFKDIFEFWEHSRLCWKRSLRIIIGMIIPFILFFSNLSMGSTFIFPILDNRAGMFDGLEIYMIPSVEADEPIDFVVKEGEEVTIQDRVFTPIGDIIVEKGGKLVLRHVKVLFNHTGCFDHGIVLKENTTLWIYHSQIRGVNNLFFFKAQNTTLIIEDSKIRRTQVLCGNSSRILIVRSHLWALHCFNESTADIVNAQLNYIFLRGRSSAQVDDSNIVEIILCDSSKASISDTTLKNIFYFDEGSTTLSNCTYVDLIRFKPKICLLTIIVLDEDTHDPISKVNITLNRPKGQGVASSLTNDDGSASFSGLEEGDYFAEIEMEGYVPLSVRIPLLNEMQHETLMIREIVEEKGPSILTNRLLPTLMATILTVLALYLFYRSHMRR